MKFSSRDGPIEKSVEPDDLEFLRVPKEEFAALLVKRKAAQHWHELVMLQLKKEVKLKKLQDRVGMSKKDRKDLKDFINSYLEMIPEGSERWILATKLMENGIHDAEQFVILLDVEKAVKNWYDLKLRMRLHT